MRIDNENQYLEMYLTLFYCQFSILPYLYVMILIVDDDKLICSSLAMLLKRVGYETVCVHNPAAAIDVVKNTPLRLIVMDMNYSRLTSGVEGLTLLKQVKLFNPEVPVILITAWGSIDLAVEGMRAGAFDFITKPWDNRILIQRIETALEISGKNELIETAQSSFTQGKIIGRSEGLRKALTLVERIAPTNAPVLITGESGTGKELIAEAIHNNSKRKGKPFVKVNLGGISQSLFESEMFGHKKGAFTGAFADRVGRFDLADGGTIFLDEIGELDLSCQVKLLRVLQEQKFEILGSSETHKVDIRVVCATNANLSEMVANHTFREDLLYRINLVTVNVPPLRERVEDIPLLVRHFASSICAENGLELPEFAPDVFTYLKTLPFTGNIRELKNLVERTILVCGSSVITGEDFRNQQSAAHSVARGIGATTIEDVERNMVKTTLEKHNNNISLAARELGISRAALYRRIEKYKLNS